VATAVIVTTASVHWHLSASGQASGQVSGQAPGQASSLAATQAQAGQKAAPSAVRPAPAGMRAGASPGQKGTTYYSFEGQAVRQTARFADATAVTERGFDGDLQTRLVDRGGTELASMDLDRVDGTNDIVRYAPRQGDLVQAYGDASAKPTLDWSNYQAYTLWKDQVGASPQLEWRGGMMRRKGAGARDVESAVVELQTEWANGFTAKTVRKSVSHHKALPGRELSEDVLVTHLTRNGTEIGVANWYPKSQILMWNIPGLTKGYIAPEHLKQFGGWPFAPDMAWLNLQITAFQHYKSRIQEKGFVAARQPGWSDRLLQFVAPSLQANEPGCDDLHWLDGSVLRFCCDVHDLCYEKVGCSSRSWWRFWSSWSCSYCNVGVVYCFFTGGTDYPDGGFRQ
jgi:hypothetical protein